MQISYVIPGDFSTSSHGEAEIARRERVLQGWAFSGTRMSATDVRNGISSIESSYEELLAAPGGIDRIRMLEADGIDAAIIGCFGDPGLEAVRQMVAIPVVGPGEASLLLAAQLGHRVGILAVYDALSSMHRNQAFRAGILDKLCSIRGIEMPVLELAEDTAATYRRLVEIGRRAIDADGAEVLILGCMTMAFLDVGHQLAEDLGVPIVNPAHAAVKAAETLVSMRIAHSRKAYPEPHRMRPVRGALNQSS